MNPRSHILLPFASLALFAACSGEGSVRPSEVELAEPQACLEGAAADSVRAASFNLSIGFKVEDLLFLDMNDDSVVDARARKLLSDARSSLPRERVREAARTIAASSPDVVGLQETLFLAVNDSVEISMLDTLLADLRDLGQDGWTLLRRPLNHVEFTTTPSDGSAPLHLEFSEGLALLVAPRWNVEEESLFPFRNVLSVDVLGTVQESERAVQYARLSDRSGFALEVWNTHLEVLSTIRQGQAGELGLISDSLRYARQRTGAAPSGRLLLGDLNAEPGVDADSMLLARGWLDAWTLGSGALPGATCCVGDLHDPASGFAETGRRIDRVLAQGACSARDAQVLLALPFVTESGDSLFASDHGLVEADLVYGVRTP